MINFQSITGTNDNDVVYTSQDISQYVEHFFRADAGSVSIQAYVNGAWTSDLAFENVESVAPTTFVLTTTGTGLYRVIGRYTKLRILQNGATPASAKGTHNE